VAVLAETLPVPDYFNLEWESPEEAAQYWTVDLMHWPHGASPLCTTFDMPPFLRGLARAANELCMPFKDYRVKVAHGYLYHSFTPYSLDPAIMGQRMQEMQGQMMKHVPGLLERWRTEYEPEVRAINNEVLTTEYQKLGDVDLSDLLERLVALRERSGLPGRLPGGGRCGVLRAGV
jgi:hypothetical protein